MNHYEEKMNRRIHYKLSPQCNMLEMVPPRRSKMFLKWQDLRKREPPPGLKPKPKERLHIWQKVNRVKEVNNLEDYFWFYEEWDRINRRFMKRFNKTFPELLMERIHHHRIKMENAMLLAGCILMLSEDENDDADAWEKNLRKYLWAPTPGALPKPPWDEGGTPKKPDDGKKEDPSPDRVGRADRDNPKFEYFKDRWAHLSKGQDDWGDWEFFCFKMAAAIDKVEPYYPDFTELLILGKRLRPPGPQPPPPPPICIEPDVPKKPVTCVPGPAALISLTYHFFVNQVGEQSIKAVMLENVGETVLFYTWERRPMEALIFTPKVHLGPHITDCRAFSVLNGTGSIQSGEKKIFPFRFKSDVPGVFLEGWVLRIAPRLPAPWTLDPIFFKGVAFSEDNFAKLRAKLSQVSYFREMMSGIDEFFVDTLNRAAKASRPTEEVRCAENYMFSSKAFNFLQKNLAMEPPVYYVPSSYQQVEAFATVVKAWEPPPPPPPPPAEKKPPPKGKAPAASAAPPPEEESTWEEELPWAWEGSFSSIITGIEGSTMSERIKQHFRSELVTLKELVQIPPRQTMLLHVAVYKMLKGITDYTEDVMEGIPEMFGRPMAEMLMNNYYDKYEKQRLEKEAEAAARMEENHEAAEAEMMEMLLEQIRLENPPLNEISLESRLGNQDMLEMCFKWLHIYTEMRLFMRVGFNDYEGQVQKEQHHLNELVDDRIRKLLPLVDEMSSWDRFALERAKQVLIHEETELLRINEPKSPPPRLLENLPQEQENVCRHLYALNSRSSACSLLGIVEMQGINQSER